MKKLKMLILACVTMVVTSAPASAGNVQKAVFNSQSAAQNFCQSRDCIAIVAIPYRYTGPIQYHVWYNN